MVPLGMLLSSLSLLSLGVHLRQPHTGLQIVRTTTPVAVAHTSHPGPALRLNRRGGVARRPAEGQGEQRTQWRPRSPPQQPRRLTSHGQVQQVVDGLPSLMDRARRAARRGEPEEALSLATMALVAATEAGARPSVKECNQLLREIGDGGHLEQMMPLFERMVEAGLRPTQVTYGTLISRAGAWSQPWLATQYYRDMLRRGLQPDVQTMNSLINAYAKAADTAKAFTAADAMLRRGLAPTLVTYNTLIDACARSGNLTLAYETLEQMRVARLRPNERTYSILIHACARQARPRGRGQGQRAGGSGEGLWRRRRVGPGAGFGATGPHHPPLDPTRSH